MTGVLLPFLPPLLLLSLPCIVGIPQCLPTRIPPTQYFYHNGLRRNVTILTTNTVESRFCHLIFLIIHLHVYCRLISAVFSILVRTVLGYDIQLVTLPHMMDRESIFQKVSTCQNKL